MKNTTVHSLLLLLWVLFAPASQAAVVNLNKANAAAMVENLEGIGPKKAAAIVAYRKANGPYKSLDDLLNVKGIGAKTIQKNRRDLSLTKGAVKAEGKAKTAAKASSSKKTAAKKSSSSKKTSSSKKASSPSSKSKKTSKKTDKKKKKSSAKTSN